MWAVLIDVNTDGDFSYEDREFRNVDKNGKDIEMEKTFYFDGRSDAVNALMRSFKNMSDSLNPYGMDYIKEWVDFINQNLPIICKKIKSFNIERVFGNQSIQYSLFECGCYKYRSGAIGYSTPMTYCYDININDIDWDKLEKLPDADDN